MNSSMRRWSLGGTQSSALNRPDARSPRGTWAATRDGRSETSNDWIARIPDSPASSRRHTVSRPMPSGVTSPMPVTTMRLMSRRSRARRAAARPTPGSRSAVRLDKADRVLDGHDLLGCVIRDLAAEFFFEGHHQLDRIEAVGPQIVDEAGVFGHLGIVDAEMLDDDLLDPLGDVAHSLYSSITCCLALLGAVRVRCFQALHRGVRHADRLKAGSN